MDKQIPLHSDYNERLPIEKQIARNYLNIQVLIARVENLENALSKLMDVMILKPTE